jgi:hypothetical protein
MPTADSVIELANTIPGLSKDQVSRVALVAKFMSDEDLVKLEEMLNKIRDEYVENLKGEIDARKNLASKYEEFKSDKARESRTSEEEAQREGETEAAESLLKDI